MISLSKFILAEGSMNGSRPIALSQAPNLWFRMGRPRITLCVKKRHDDGKQHANAKHRFHSRMAIGERYCSQWLQKPTSFSNFDVSRFERIWKLSQKQIEITVRQGRQNVPTNHWISIEI
jgi:hypothetical protein